MKLSYEINEHMIKEIDKLTELAGGSRKALLDNAVTILQWAVKKVEDGMTVGAYNGNQNTFTELDMPIFNNVRMIRRGHK